MGMVVFEDFRQGWQSSGSVQQQPLGAHAGKDVWVTDKGLVIPRASLFAQTIDATAPNLSTSPLISAGAFDKYAGPTVASSVGPLVFFATAGATPKVWRFGVDGRWNVIAATISSTTLATRLPSFHNAFFDNATAPLLYALNSEGAVAARGILRMNTSGALTVTDIATPAAWHTCLCRWNDRGVAAEANTNRIWYSDAAAFNTWGSGSFVYIGEGAPITSLVPTPTILYVGTAVGWYGVTGVLGSTTTVRQLSSSPSDTWGQAVPWASGALGSDLRNKLTLFAGSRSRVLADTTTVAAGARTFSAAGNGWIPFLQPNGVALSYQVGGTGILISEVATEFGIRHAYHVLNPTTENAIPINTLTGYAYESRAIFILQDSATNVAKMARLPFDQRPLGDTSSTANTGVLSLPEIVAKDSAPFRIKAVHVEFYKGKVYLNSSGIITSGWTGSCSITAQVTATGALHVLNLPTTPPPQSTALTITEPASGYNDDERDVWTFPVDDCPEAFSFRIDLTLKMVSVRRVIVETYKLGERV